MSKDETDRLDRMERQLTRIETAVLGDEKAGAMGLVFRMNNHAKRIARIERFGAYAVGAVFAMEVAWRLYVEWPKK